MSENTENKTLLCSHSATRFLYQVEVKSIGGILLEGVQIGREWEPAPRRNETFRMNCHNDCAADIDNGLFPYALAMSRAWGILACEHAYAFQVRIVPHEVKTEYAANRLAPLAPLEAQP
jgi:hypothetical protein